MVVKQDLTELDVDVIVNAADAKLKLEGGLALVIGQKGQTFIHSFIQFIHLFIHSIIVSVLVKF